jgi:hypothetical protein
MDFVLESGSGLTTSVDFQVFFLFVCSCWSVLQELTSSNDLVSFSTKSQNLELSQAPR